MSVRTASEDVEEIKDATQMFNEIETGAADNGRPSRALEAPPLVKALTPEDRKRVERTLVRKIDFRLLPPVIIMYIMVRFNNTGYS